MKRAIECHLRVRPSPGMGKFWKINSGDLGDQSVEFHVEKKVRDYEIDNSLQDWKFGFHGVHGPETKQDEIFERLAKKCASSALDGFNSTIFAYGQTGSGKTYTMTGGGKTFEDRGIIPRCIQYIYEDTERRSDRIYQIYITYMEIYQGKVYDLLYEGRKLSKGGSNPALEDLPKVILREDENGMLHFTNLSVHPARDASEALDLLFDGDVVKCMSENALNAASSRSHVLFTINITSQEPGSDMRRDSKLHLVDLAGSERIHKTGTGDKTLEKEGMYINGSLSSLEQVIVTLQKKAEGKWDFIPYRGSPMTHILRDSLGGNCETVMIANVWAEEEHVRETISTCRFAQRVASIKNERLINQSLDPALVLKRLKAENRRLREEIAILRGTGDEVALTDSEKQRISAQIVTYVEDQDPDAELELTAMTRIRYAYTAFKRMVLDKVSQFSKIPSTPPEDPMAATPRTAPAVDPSELSRLKQLLIQRDNEISILTSMLGEKEGGTVAKQVAARNPPLQVDSGSLGKPPVAAKSAKMPAYSDDSELETGLGVSESADKYTTEHIDLSVEDLKDKSKVFRAFRSYYVGNSDIEGNKKLLQDKYTEAKKLGQVITARKSRIGNFKQIVDQMHMERAVRTMQGEDGGAEAAELDPEEERLRQDMMREKVHYKDEIGSLKKLKVEIEHLHRLLEQNRTKLQQDFEQWYRLTVREKRRAEKAKAGVSHVPGPSLVAGATPTTSHMPEALEPAGPGLTGNAEADEDIAKFYAIRDQLMAKSKTRSSGLDKEG